MGNDGIEKVLQDRQVLFKEGDVGDEMYLIKQGRIKIIKKIGDEIKVLAILSEGDFFGEMAVIDNSPRSATAVADGETHVITFDKKAFKKKIGEEPLVEYIVTELTKRLRRADEQIKFLMIKSEEKRLIAYIITKAQENGIKQQDGTILLNILFTMENIASIVGINPKKLQTMLSQLQKANLVRLMNDRLLVTNLQGMEEYLKYISLKEKFGG